ncbi:MAG: carboxymuconolactone decarboxylase family protein [Nostoc sp. ChiQUE02]|uniref:carboxymuconolactone decarboxylase family protein n=1 Tax=Nostoc sp. ChiQUE02 TaxID=3075377 RepID=UPI002AD283D8|nr:carboxymuconolactone decarboxylase family protein [Nostoc sp. ChiQUE02]MDZ8228975.1 carboxymuconolactone decarboxylase family protein [Nostoc sp. ChiQUE02]
MTNTPQKDRTQSSVKISEAAHKNHEELFPNHKSTLKVTDPELIEVFDNFAFDEVIAESKLDTKTRVMLILASIIGSQAVSEYRVMVAAALNVGVTPVEIKEILYQSVPYVGMAKAFDFVHATNEVMSSRGIQLPLEGQSTTSPETRYDKGLAVQKAIFGETIDQMYERSPKDQLHIQRFLSANCFGDYYTRNGVYISVRELITLSILIALGGVESQIKGHIQGNLNVGNGKDILLDLITQLLPWVGYPRTLNALKCLNEVATE